MNKRRIVLTALIGAVALAAVPISLTLAWYGSSDRLKVNSFDIDMTGDVQLLMSTSKDLSTFKQELKNEDLVEKDFAFAPVSSMYKDEWFSQKKDMPLFYDCSSPVSKGGVELREEALNGFFSKKVYLLSNVVDYYVSLDVSKCAFNSNEAANAIRAQELHTQFRDASVEDITKSLNELKNCLRMSILVNTEDYYRYYIIDPYRQDNEEILFGGVLDNDADGYYDYYLDGDNKIEYVYGEIEDRSKINYFNPVDPNGYVEKIKSNGSFYGNSFVAKNRIDAYTFDDDGSSDLKIAKEDSYTLEEADGLDTEILIPCYHNEPTEIVVSIYLEGWDKACINQTMGACFDTNISFKLLRRIL